MITGFTNCSCHKPGPEISLLAFRGIAFIQVLAEWALSFVKQWLVHCSLEVISILLTYMCLTVSNMPWNLLKGILSIFTKPKFLGFFGGSMKGI